MKTIVIAVVALIIGGAGAGYYGMMQVDDVTQKLALATQKKDQAVQNANRLGKANDDAAKKYGSDLGKLVATAGSDDPAKQIDNARAILAARDGFRASIDGVRATLDSDFDALALELGNATPNTEKIRQLLDGLKQGWPDREKNMEGATRKLLTDLGIGQAPAAPKPASAPAPAASAPAAPAASAPAPAAATPAPAAKK